MSNISKYQQILIDFAKGGVNISEHDARRLARLSCRVSRIDEYACNGYASEWEQCNLPVKELGARCEKREKACDMERERKAALVRKIVESYGLKMAAGNEDPRGYPFGVHFENGFFNSFGGREYGCRF